MWEAFRTSPTVQPDSENVGVAVVISLLSFSQAEIQDLARYFRLMVAMSDKPVTPMSKSNHTSLIVLLDPANVEVAVGISLLSHTQAEL